MLFQYATKTGALKTIEANSAAEAMQKAPDIAPHSGVMQAQTQTSERSLPDVANTGKADLPQDTTPTPGRIANLQDALTTAVDMGRQKRNRILSSIVGTQFGGNLRAGDFASVLDSASKVSDRTYSTILDTYNKGKDDEVLSVSDAKALHVPYGTTKSQAAAMGLTPGNAEDDVKLFTSEQKTRLAQAGLSNADPRVQVSFVSAEPEFQTDWIRNNAGAGMDKSTTQLDRLIQDIADWEAMYGSITPKDPAAADDMSWLNGPG